MLQTDMGVHAGGSRVGNVLHLPPDCLQDSNVFMILFQVKVFIITCTVEK